MGLFSLTMFAIMVTCIWQSFAFYRDYRDPPLALAWLLLALGSFGLTFPISLAEAVGLSGLMVIVLMIIPGALLLVIRQNVPVSREALKAPRKPKKVHPSLKDVLNAQRLQYQAVVIKTRLYKALKVLLGKDDTISRVDFENLGPSKNDGKVYYGEFIPKEEYESSKTSDNH